MVRKFGPFDTSVFYEVENRRMQRAFNPQTGFVKTGQGAVTAGTGAELIIAAYPDGALIDGLYVENPASETVTLTTNSGSTNPRIDRLVMRLDMAAETIAPFQIVGTPAASPQAPPLVQTADKFDMPLVRYTMPGSASAQNPSSIVDEREWTALGLWQEVDDGTGYSFGLSNTIQQVPFPGGGTSKTHTVPAGRQLECEFVIPRLTIPSLGTVQFNLQDGAAILDGGEVSTPNTLWVPLRLRGVVIGDGAAHTIAVRAWQGGGSGAEISGSPPTGAAVKYRWRLI